MKRVSIGAAALAALVALVGGIDFLADLTQDRPDPVTPGSRSEIVLDVDTRGAASRSPLLAAQGLWGACQGTVRHRLVEPGLTEMTDGHFVVQTEPALGEHAWRRLQGCLEDTTLDRVKGRVVTKRDLPPPT